MSTIIFGSTVSLVTSATPSAGGYIIGYDIDGILKQKDSFGNILEIGGGPTAGNSGTASLLDVLSIGNTTGQYDIIFGTGSKISSLNGSGEISLDEGSTSGLISISTGDGTDYSKIYVSPTFSQIGHSVGTTFSNLTIQKGDSILLTGDSDNFTTIRTSQNIFKVEFTIPSLLDGQIKIVESGTTYDTGSLNKAFLHLNTWGSTTDAGVQNAVIIGGQGISASESDSVYVPQLVIQNSKLIKGSTGGGVVDLTNGDVVLTNSSTDATIGIFSPLSTSTWLSSSNGILVVDSSTGSTSPNVDSPNVFISTRGSYLGPGVENSVIVGGIGLSGISSNTVYLGNSVNINGQFTLPSLDGTTGQILKTDGLGNVTWQDETVSSGTNSLDEILQEGNNTQVYDIIMGTGTGIRSSNTGGSIFLDSSGNPGEVLISTDDGSLVTSYIELGVNDILLDSSSGFLNINCFESNIVVGDNEGLKYSFDYSSSFVTYSLVSKNYVDSKDISSLSLTGLTGSFSSGVLSLSSLVDSDSIEINSNNQISVKSSISGNRTFLDSLTVNGNLTILGTTSTINTENLIVEDNFISLNSGYSGPAIDSGLEINLGDGTYSKIFWNSQSLTWFAGLSGSESSLYNSVGLGLTSSGSLVSVETGEGLSISGSNSISIGGTISTISKIHVDGTLNIETLGQPDILVISGSANNLGIGTSSANPDAIVDIWSDTKPLIIPRISATAASLISPVEGMICYVNSTNLTFPIRGFWGYTDTGWIKLS